MTQNKFILRCNCGYKRWSNGQDTDDLVMIDLCASCSGSKQFKCPQCGYLMKPRKYISPPNPKDNDFKLH